MRKRQRSSITPNFIDHAARKAARKKAKRLTAKLDKHLGLQRIKTNRVKCKDGTTVKQLLVIDAKPIKPRKLKRSKSLIHQVRAKETRIFTSAS